MRKKTAPLATQRTLRMAAFAVLAITAAAAAYMLIWPGPTAGAPGGPGDTRPTTAGRIDPSLSYPVSTAGPNGTDPSGGAPTGVIDPGASGQAGVTRPIPTAYFPGLSPGGEEPVSPASTASAGGATAMPGDTTGTQPRYAGEVSLFLSRVGAVGEALSASRFHLGFYEVDAANPTSMVVLAATKERADNLDGFFRLAIDLDGETWGNAPLALGLTRLYTESGRDRAYADGTFTSDGLDTWMGAALSAALGDAYEPGMLDFILEEYRTGMETRVLTGGVGRTGYRAVAPFSRWDVVYNDGYVTFVEFYPGSMSPKT